MFKKHVGRPSNEEIKRRRIKKAIVVLLPIIIIFIGIIAISKGNLKSLMGNSVSGEYYCEDESYTLNGRECVKTITMEPNLLGDANLDGKIDINDITTISKSIANNDTANITYVADINNDKLVNETDIKLVQAYLGDSIQSTVGYTDNIGVVLVCPNDFKLDNNICKKEDRIQAMTVKSQQEDKSLNSNSNIGENRFNTSEEENNDSKIEPNSSSYVIKFDANGGTGKMDNAIVDEKVTNIPENKFVKGNEKFKGWTVYNKTTDKWLIYLSKTKSIFDEINQTTSQWYSPRVLLDKSSVSLIPASAGDELIFYAQWDNTYTIKYNANGGTGVMLNQTIRFGKNTQLSKNQFSRSGYNFIGWRSYNNKTGKWYCKIDNKGNLGKTDKNTCEKYGYVLYKDQATVAKSGNPGDNLTFYAQWNNKFTIKYNANGGNGSMNQQLIVYGQNTKISKNKFSKSGYGFAGWKKYNNTTGKWYCSNDTNASKCSDYAIYKDQATVAKSGNPGDNLTFYATWTSKPVSASITELEGSTNLPKGSVITSGIYFKVNDNTRDYYYKWYAYKNGNTINKPSCIKVPKSKYTEVKLTIDGTKSGKVELYWDSNCKTKIKSNNTITTQTFTCSNCNSQGSYNSNNQSNYNNSSSTKSSNSSKKNNCKTYNYSYTCPSGWTKVGDGPNSYCQQASGYSYTCPSGYTKVGDGPTAYCQSKTKTAGKCKYNRYIVKGGGYSCSVNSGKFKDSPSCKQKCYSRKTQSIKRKRTYATKQVTVTKNCLG